MRWFLPLLGALLFVNALALVYFKHSNRQLLAQLHELQLTRDTLNNEWTQLLLEQSTLVAHSRVDRLARQELNMTLPHASEVVWIDNGSQ